jgi:hypothetical protein
MKVNSMTRLLTTIVSVWLLIVLWCAAVVPTIASTEQAGRHDDDGGAFTFTNTEFELMMASDLEQQ